MMKKALIQTFEHVACDYDQFNYLVQVTAKSLLKRLRWMKIKPALVVESGCGSGYGLSLWQSALPSATIIGVDFAFAMLERVTNKSAWLLNADAEQLPLANSSADIIIANLSIAWCHLSKWLQCCYQVLKPNGLLLFATLGPDTLKEVRVDYRNDALLDMHDIGDLLIQTKFIEPVMEVEYIQFNYSSCQKFIREFQVLGLKHLVTLQSLHPDKLSVNFEIIYGHAWRPAVMASDQKHIINIPLSKITRRGNFNF